MNLFAFVLLLAPGNDSTLFVQNQPPAKPKAMTRLEEVDGDFAYQGEYVAVTTGRSPRWTHGLQVIARGEGKFEASLYAGGLPGAGAQTSSRRRLTGHRQGDTLLLTDTEGQVSITGRQALLSANAGGPAITLTKIERSSPRLNVPPPTSAIRLFDGTDTGELRGLKISPEGLMEIGAETKRVFGDFQMHVEFLLPYMPSALGQGRGNSGVYIQRRYEVQILDSFGLPGEFNECAALYRQQSPEVNMCLPPLTWQSYDIWFRAARWDDEGQKVGNARITVVHNGVAVHDQREITAKTGAGQPEGPQPLTILFQNHGDPVVFRNVWIVELEPEATVEPLTCAGPIRHVVGNVLRRAAQVGHRHAKCGG